MKVMNKQRIEERKNKEKFGRKMNIFIQFKMKKK